MTRRLLVVVAHPDDETFGCGSIIAHAVSKGVKVTVACATRGEEGEPAQGSGLTRETLGDEREHELRAAAALLGVQRVELLGFRDSAMSGELKPGALVAAPQSEVVDAIRVIIDDAKPDVAITLDGTDGHRDHISVRDALLAAVKESSSPPSTVYLSCLSRSLLLKWSDHMRLVDPASPYLNMGELGMPDEDITTIVDTSAHIALRRQAIKLHASQVSPFDVVPAGLQAEFLGVDRLRRVVPPWTNAPVENDIF